MAEAAVVALPALIIGAESFKDSICKRNPETSREFKNSIGKCTPVIRQVQNPISTDSGGLIKVVGCTGGFTGGCTGGLIKWSQDVPL